MATLYTVGFAFSENRKYVALIEKQRPKWQAGKLNGIGGHVENGERFAIAQQREFWEETGVVIPANEWKAYATLVGPDWQVRCFSAFTDEIHKVVSKTDESVHVLPVEHFGILRCLDNLSYLIPLALDNDQVGVPMFHYGKRPMPNLAAQALEETFEEVALEDVLEQAAAGFKNATTIAA